MSSDGTIQVWRSASAKDVSQSIDDLLIKADDALDNDTALALRDLNEILAQSPTDLRVRTLRGRLYDRLGDLGVCG